jgi:hypothetical protein
VLLEEAAQAARAAGRLDLAEQHLRELLALRAAEDTQQAATRVRAELASVLLMAQRNEPALAELESAVAAIGDIGADASGVELAAQLARARVVVGQDAAGLEWADRALRAARRLDLKAVEADLLATRGTARFQLGDEAGLADLRDAISAAEAADALAIELRARNNLAWLSVADDPRATLETARMGYELARTMGVGDLAAQLADVACAVAVRTGDWSWALDTADTLDGDGLAEAYRIAIGSSAAIIHALRGDARPMAALDRLGPMPATIDPQVAAAISHARAWSAFAAGQLAEAWQLSMSAAGDSLGAERAHQLTLAGHAAVWSRDGGALSKALTDLRAMGLRGRAVAAACLTLEAGERALAGSADASAAYHTAADAWRELDLPLDLALCLAEAQLAGDGDGAEAAALLGRLGADALLGRLAGRLRSRSAAGRPARPRRPSARTASPTGVARPRRLARDRPRRRG